MHRRARFAALSLLLTGCYSIEPMATSKPTPGTRVALAINDSGRMALGGSMGPEIRRVEGSLLNQENNEYVLSVTGVNYLNGTFQSWKGETVRINERMVMGLYEKKFSKGRTVALIAVGVAAAFAAKPTFFKSSLPDPTPPPPGVEESRRPRTGIRLRLSR